MRKHFSYFCRVCCFFGESCTFQMHQRVFNLFWFSVIWEVDYTTRCKNNNQIKKTLLRTCFVEVQEISLDFVVFGIIMNVYMTDETFTRTKNNNKGRRFSKYYKYEKKISLNYFWNEKKIQLSCMTTELTTN